MLHIVLYQPEIPHNTGNVIRLCANTGCTLHIVEPMSFELSDKNLKRAGLDYHGLVKIDIHKDWNSCCDALAEHPWTIFTTKAKQLFHEVSYQADHVLVFGPETRGLPTEIVNEFCQKQQAARIPMVPASRSINLSNSVAIAVYEAWRQNQFIGENLTGAS